MSTFTERIKNWVSSSFQLIIICLLVGLLALVIKQQNDIKLLHIKISYIENSLSSDIDDAKNQLSSEIENAKDELSSDIDGVESTVRIWSN